jgi:hypothetical protein
MLLYVLNPLYQVMEETSGRDLAMMLWLKSKTSDVWMERRANFTKVCIRICICICQSPHIKTTSKSLTL